MVLETVQAGESYFYLGGNEVGFELIEWLLGRRVDRMDGFRIIK